MPRCLALTSALPRNLRSIDYACAMQVKKSDIYSIEGKKKVPYFDEEGDE